MSEQPQAATPVFDFQTPLAEGSAEMTNETNVWFKGSELPRHQTGQTERAPTEAEITVLRIRKSQRELSNIVAARVDSMRVEDRPFFKDQTDSAFLKDVA